MNTTHYNYLASMFLAHLGIYFVAMGTNTMLHTIGGILLFIAGANILAYHKRKVVKKHHLLVR
jgi:hypothetical protein